MGRYMSVMEGIRGTGAKKFGRIVGKRSLFKAVTELLASSVLRLGYMANSPMFAQLPFRREGVNT